MKEQKILLVAVYKKQKKKCSACIIDIEKIHSYLNDLKEPKKKICKEANGAEDK